jgi:hypothetical protein
LILQDFVHFKSFLIKKIKAKELLKEGSKGTSVNEGRFVLNIDILFANITALKADRCVYFK